MARKASKEPTDAELRILHCLWAGGAMRLSEIAAALARDGDALANTTVATMLKVMSEKKLVRRTKRGANVVWKAAVTREKAGAGSVDRLLDRLFDGSASKLVAHLISGGKLTEQDKAEIEGLLATSDAPRRKSGPKGKAS